MLNDGEAKCSCETTDLELTGKRQPTCALDTVTARDCRDQNAWCLSAVSNGTNLNVCHVLKSSVSTGNAFFFFFALC